MITRYTREEIGAVWSPQRKLECWLEVELAATEAWAEEGAVPREAAEAARANAAFTVEAVASVRRSPTTTSPPSSTWWRSRSASTAAGSTTG